MTTMNARERFEKICELTIGVPRDCGRHAERGAVRLVEGIWKDESYVHNNLRNPLEMVLVFGVMNLVSHKAQDDIPSEVSAGWPARATEDELNPRNGGAWAVWRAVSSRIRAGRETES